MHTYTNIKRNTKQIPKFWKEVKGGQDLLEWCHNHSCPIVSMSPSSRRRIWNSDDMMMIWWGFDYDMMMIWWGCDYDMTASKKMSWYESAKHAFLKVTLKKVKVTYFDAKLCQTIWNHAKKSMEGSKLSDSVFLQWEVTDWQELFVKNEENKGN